MPSTKSWSILRDQVLSRPGAAEQIEASRIELEKEIRDYVLGELQRALGLSEEQLLKMIRRLRNDDALIGAEHVNLRVNTLQALVEQAGGHLELIAIFPDRTTEILL